MDYESLINKSLDNVFPEDSGDITIDAARYSLLAGGKRLRPKMMFMTYKMLGNDPSFLDDVSYYATTLEMIHTYSLIHDDLPCMDNDDLRRGKPTCHKVYGAGIATLAGDLLLNTAMERLMKIVCDKPQYAYASYRLAALAGSEGMIGGQSIDISSENIEIPLERLYELQAKKTGALIENAVVTPYYLINGTAADSAATDKNVKLLKELAGHIGLAFQIRDDILDVTANQELLGKSVGKDERDHKSTFVTLLGFEEANNKLKEEINKAGEVLDSLSGVGYDVEEYRDLVGYLLVRGN